MGLRLKIIVNPSSGRERAKSNVEDILAYLSSINQLERADICYTAAKHDATRFARTINPEEYDCVIAAGGDGTVNEVVTGIMQEGIDIPLAIYTSGTVNDLATSINLPSEPNDFARMLLRKKTSRIDCGKVGDYYFMNVLAGGLMTDVAYKVPSALKTNLGPVAYWISALADFPDLNRTIQLKITANDVKYDVEATLFFVSNSQSVAGFRKLMTEAELNDGLLDVLVLRKVAYADVFPLLGKLMVGDHIHNDNVIYFQTDMLSIETDADTHVVTDLDGEKGPALPVNIECLHKALKLIVPDEEDVL